MESSNFKQWVIVFFAPENKYSIVPVKWIIYCGKICFCKWPKKGNINNMIKDFIEPENDWPTYPITVVSQYFDDYSEASMKEKEIFTSSDTTPTKKKRTKQSVAISDCPNDPESVPFKICKPSITNIISNAIDTSIRCDEVDNALQELNTENVSTYQNVTENFYNVDQYSPCAPVISNNLSQKTYEMIKKNFEMHITTLEYIKRMDAKLELLEKKIIGSPVHNAYDSNLLSLLPFKNKESVDAADEKLKTDSNFERQMSNYVYRVGGTSIKNYVQRVFAKIFSLDIARKYSMKGCRGNHRLDS
ncbi:uncharacterized protein LOC126902649 [Daktulosphaira vitifoliae]|uniref:uncharacterized protein LOC126902649 n=1 Tax=Daktulosphaira vitifoliae TaxID=58002 RepID=UPI0021AA312E|nr:uncharacterized protein LOC126902649 [Daktulosphaira vitifoliae]